VVGLALKFLGGENRLPFNSPPTIRIPVDLTDCKMTDY
jgi:hypothetical protein